MTSKKEEKQKIDIRYVRSVKRALLYLVGAFGLSPFFPVLEHMNYKKFKQETITPVVEQYIVTKRELYELRKIEKIPAELESLYQTKEIKDSSEEIHSNDFEKISVLEEKLANAKRNFIEFLYPTKEIKDSSEEIHSRDLKKISVLEEKLANAKRNFIELSKKEEVINYLKKEEVMRRKKRDYGRGFMAVLWGGIAVAAFSMFKGDRRYQKEMEKLEREYPSKK